MSSTQPSAPPPELRIVPTDSLLPHEDHDSQRSEPLIERLQHDTVVINPPIVAPLDGDRYVILDGANRCHAFAQLGYPHALVQVVRYGTGEVDLDTWRHVVCAWTEDEFIQHLRRLPGVALTDAPDEASVARVTFPDGRARGLNAEASGPGERNAALRHVVGVYQRNAVLHRTAVDDPARVWTMYARPVALVSFPAYRPEDILTAARERAYLPPGVSRHIVHGRAVRLNYPLDALRDRTGTLADKNAALESWVREKTARRQVRYYAESTYQFDE